MQIDGCHLSSQMYLVLFSERLSALTHNSTREVSVSGAIRLQLEAILSLCLWDLLRKQMSFVKCN